MVINVLVCHADGTQTLEERTVPEDFYVLPEYGTSEEQQPQADVQ